LDRRLQKIKRILYAPEIITTIVIEEAFSLKSGLQKGPQKKERLRLRVPIWAAYSSSIEHNDNK